MANFNQCRTLAVRHRTVTQMVAMAASIRIPMLLDAVESLQDVSAAQLL